MGLSTERKVFLGVMAVAGIAFFVDQGLLGPAGASADMIEPQVDSIIAQPAIVTGTEPTKVAAAVLIDRIKSVSLTSSTDSFGSAFSLTQLVEQPIPAQIDGNNDLNEMGQGLSQATSSSFPSIAPKATDLPTLSSVMPSKSGGAAVLGGKLVRVGQVGPAGYRLIGVEARSIVVERDGTQYTIQVPTSSNQN